MVFFWTFRLSHSDMFLSCLIVPVGTCFLASLYTQTQLCELSDYHLVSLSSLCLPHLSLVEWRAGLCVTTGGLLYSIVFLTHTLPCLFSPLSSPSFPSDWTPIFQRLPLVTLFIHLFQRPFSQPESPLPRQKGKIIIWLCTVCTLVYTQCPASCFTHFKGCFILLVQPVFVAPLSKNATYQETRLFTFLPRDRWKDWFYHICTKKVLLKDSPAQNRKWFVIFKQDITCYYVSFTCC